MPPESQSTPITISSLPLPLPEMLFELCDDRLLLCDRDELDEDFDDDDDEEDGDEEDEPH